MTITRIEYGVRGPYGVIPIGDFPEDAEGYAQWAGGEVVERTVYESDWCATASPDEDDVVDAEILDDEHPFAIGQHVRRVGNPWWAVEWLVVDNRSANWTQVRRWDTTIMIRNDDYEAVPFLWPQDATGRELVHVPTFPTSDDFYRTIVAEFSALAEQIVRMIMPLGPKQ